MVEPMTWHPAADRVTAEAVIVEQDRSVVPLSTWLADAAVAAGRAERVLQVLTPAHSRITFPLELMLRDTGAEWVVRDGPERFRDGLAGFVMRWNGARFVADVQAPTPDPVDPPPGSGDLEVHITTLHPASESLELGAAAEAALRALTGDPPTGWGVAEPATQPWSAREITAYCRDGAPNPAQLVVVGSGVVGQLAVERVDTGMLERVRLSGPPAGAVSQDSVDALAAEIVGTARLMIVAAHPGRLHGLRANAPTLPALPYAILVGHGQVAERGADHAMRAPVERVRLLGTGPRQACWARLDGGPGSPYENLATVLNHFGMPDQPA
ncbi:DUF6177 family protein [Gandjariella thermophila]|uniref:Uncharacterized protein n=1 Tax=Gandjariella thermophila TaxID=1931992 RepID=A0A4D4JFU4_9PSEU|nr:DUF6177 family protein [Gandjariella thermophila]GDY33528.1 hypothetical protein GTS_51610 [Gandjariella thermophila]